MDYAYTRPCSANGVNSSFHLRITFNQYTDNVLYVERILLIRELIK